MEKKSTKIAYFVALGVFIVLLVVLGISYKDAPILIEDATTPFAGTFWSLLPPIVAIVLALISKEVYSSLFLGCLVGALLVSNRQLHSGRSDPERGRQPAHCLCADGRHSAGHPRYHGQEASGYLPGDGRGRQGSGQVSPLNTHLKNRKPCGASCFLRVNRAEYRVKSLSDAK